MKKIILTERQLKLLEDVQQYTSDGSEVKDFYSNIDLGNIDFKGHDNNLEVHKSSNVVVDWSVLFLFSEKGFDMKLKVNRVYGKINIASWESKQIVKEFNVDTKRGWNLKSEIYIDDNMNSDNFYLDIDFGNKTIVIK